MHATFMCMISHNICGKVRIKQQYAAFIYQCIYVPVYLMYIKYTLRLLVSVTGISFKGRYIF